MNRKLKFIVLNIFCLIFLSFSLIKIHAAYDTKYLNKDFAPNYYDGLNLNQNAEDFKQDLAVIISTGYVRQGYTELATLYKTSDIDPNDSTKVICLYTKNSLDNTSASVGGWDREHVWAKSHGFPSGGTYVDVNGTEIKYENTDPYTDAHHLRPATANINRTRYDYDFGELDDTCTLNYEDVYGNKICKDLRTFEPADHCKGDVARMLLYMDTRYGFVEPFNLKLVDDAHTTGTNGNGKVGNLQTLLKWHYADPVDDSEIYRNNVIYDTWQHNRNPYIDHPEWVSIAYPNSYDSGSIGEEKVNAVIALITALPNVITLADEAQVEAAKNAYDELTDVEKSSVTNASKLINAVHTIQSLKFIDLNTGASLKIIYNGDIKTSDIDLRFGGIIPSNVYIDGANYGVIVTEKWYDDVVAGMYENQSITDFLGNHSFYKSMSCTPVCVSLQAANYIEDPDGEFYQFAWVITDMSGHYNANLKAFMYMEYDGNLYLSHSKCYSVVSIAKYYYDHRVELGLSSNQIQWVHDIASMGMIGDHQPGDTDQDFYH